MPVLSIRVVNEIMNSVKEKKNRTHHNTSILVHICGRCSNSSKIRKRTRNKHEKKKPKRQD